MDIESERAYSKNIRDELTPEQLKLLEQFHEQIKDDIKSDYERKWCNDRCLCRYLRARDWELPKSLHMLRETLKWRRTYKPHLITAKDVLVELKNDGKMYRMGKDKQGRPIMYMKPGLDNTVGSHDKDVKVRYLVYILEKAIKSMDESQGVEKIVWVIDYSGYSQLTGMSMTKIAMEIVGILQDHYPERLGQAFLFHAPWVWTFFWKMLSPFLNEVTKNKLRMIGKDNSAVLDAIDVDQLEIAYGGNNTFKYNFDEHWEKEDKEHPITDEERESLPESS